MNPPLAAVLGTSADRWLLALSIAALVVVSGGAWARRAARTTAEAPGDEHRGTRRRAGALLAVGPVVGFVVAPRAGDHVAVLALGAAGLAVFGMLVERRRAVDRAVFVAALCAALVAIAAGVRFAPTGVGALDVGLGFAVVFLATIAFDGLGNRDGLVPGLGIVAALGFLVLGGFAEQYGIANGAAGILGAGLGFLAFCVPPASLFPGRAGRLATGYALGVLACSVTTSSGPPTDLVVGLLLVAVPLLDLTIVVFDRVQRRRPVVLDRRDHLANRLVAHGASPLEAVVALVATQTLLAVLAVLGGRGVLPVLLVTIVGLLVVGALGGHALRAPLERDRPTGPRARVWWVVALVAGVLALGTVPIVLDVPDITSTMQKGRDAARGGLAAARVGDSAEAELKFRRAAGYFDEARDRLASPRYEAARLVPGIAPNVRATRALADIGYELAHNGEVVTAAVVPEALTVFDGRLPIDEVRRVTPALQRGAATLERALARLEDIEREPYLLGAVRDTIASIRPELRRGAREARNTAAAARLAPAILGADGAPRRYLLVVQNPAENRGTGGLIGSYGILTADDGEIRVSPLERTAEWNAATTAAAPDLDAPDDYRRRYGQFQPATHLQAANLSPDFPTVGKVLAGLAPSAGLGEVDGVIGVDPMGLAAILELTGPVLVPGWPVEISANNVVDVTLRDAYAAFAQTPERADFLGDVAAAVVERATRGALGDPAAVARVLGAAAHQGHLVLWFEDRAEQHLARDVRISGELSRGFDLVHVTNANFAANKLDYYLERDLDYRLEVRPDATGREADAVGSLDVRLTNTAPRAGLPQIVAGPYEGASPGEFSAGENVSFLSVYTPLAVDRTTLDGAEVPTLDGEELGVHVSSTMVRLQAQQERTVRMDLSGRLRIARGGWYVLHLGSQPMVDEGTARVSIAVPDGYRITAARGLQRVHAGRATGIVSQSGPATVRVKIERHPGSVWGRLDRGT